MYLDCINKYIYLGEGEKIIFNSTSRKDLQKLTCYIYLYIQEVVHKKRMERSYFVTLYKEIINIVSWQK